MGKKLVFESAIITTLLIVLVLSVIGTVFAYPNMDESNQAAYDKHGDWVAAYIAGYYAIGYPGQYCHEFWCSARGSVPGMQASGNMVVTWSYLIGGGWVDMSGSVPGDLYYGSGYINPVYALKCFTSSWFIDPSGYHRPVQIQITALMYAT